MNECDKGKDEGEDKLSADFTFFVAKNSIDFCKPNEAEVSLGEFKGGGMQR